MILPKFLRFCGKYTFPRRFCGGGWALLPLRPSDFSRRVRGSFAAPPVFPRAVCSGRACFLKIPPRRRRYLFLWVRIAPHGGDCLTARAQAVRLACCGRVRLAAGAFGKDSRAPPCTRKGHRPLTRRKRRAAKREKKTKKWIKSCFFCGGRLTRGLFSRIIVGMKSGKLALRVTVSILLTLLCAATVWFIFSNS